MGDVLQVLGMRHHGEIHDFRPGALGRLLSAMARNRYIIASVCAMAVSFFAFLALVSIADISFAVPISAASFIFETVFARLLLKEHIDWRRWAGCSLVACGVVLLSV
jgi:uncharacterized membrane protein